MFKEFKDFAMRGNVLDMAIGIIIGSAFGTIVKSFVDDIIMPPIGLLLSGVDFTNLFVVLKEGSVPKPYESITVAQEVGAVTLNFGIFINTLISFLIIAFVVFLIVRAMNKVQKEEEQIEEPSTKDCPFCYSQISIKATGCSSCTSDL
jgi:large conductance mechanosensitive channel